MLNLLIAQMSDTFSNVQGDAQRSLAINRARTIISIERTGLSFLVSNISLDPRPYFFLLLSLFIHKSLVRQQRKKWAYS